MFIQQVLERIEILYLARVVDTHDLKGSQILRRDPRKFAFLALASRKS